MIKITYQNEQDYINFVQNILVFTHLRAYNASAHLWKKEDLPYVAKVRDEEYRKNNFEDWQKSVDIWTQAEKDYGNEMDYWRDMFKYYSEDCLLNSFGFNCSDMDEDISIVESVEMVISDLSKNDNYPTVFPCVMCLENGYEYDGPNIKFVCLNDFKEESPKLDFGWLKENVLNFWKNGEGNFYG